MNELTDSEKWDMINIQITKDYPKMVADANRITSYNKVQFEDLLPFCITELLTKKPLDYLYQLIVLDKKLPNYMGKSMSLNIRSSTSPYWIKYRREGYNSRGGYLADTKDEFNKKNFDEIRLDTEFEAGECALKALEALDFYHNTLLTEHFMNNMTFVAIRKKYGISIAHIRKDIAAGVKLIQQKCNQLI